MSRPIKESKPLNIKLAMDLFNKLESYCKETGMTKTATVEQGLKRIFNEYESTKKSQ